MLQKEKRKKKGIVDLRIRLKINDGNGEDKKKVR
jgi:hypothetical protein